MRRATVSSPDLCHIGRAEPARCDRAAADRIVAAVAARQHGVVARRQLLSAGLSREMIATRLAAARLLRLHPGVYAVGHAQLTANGRRLAAVLACGPRAVLSHRSAAALHGLRPHGGPIEVSTPVNRRRVDGVRLHARRPLASADRTVVARKANALALEGWTVLRFTHDDVVRRPDETATTLRAALRR